MINQDKWNKLAAWMLKLQINKSDLIEKFIIGSGSGGQKMHKTASAVYLKHLKSGIEVKCQDTRLREDNRYFARKRLCEKLHAILSDEKTKEQQKIEKLKRQKKRRSRRSKKKNVDKTQLSVEEIKAGL